MDGSGRLRTAYVSNFSLLYVTQMRLTFVQYKIYLLTYLLTYLLLVGPVTITTTVICVVAIVVFIVEVAV